MDNLHSPQFFPRELARTHWNCVNLEQACDACACSISCSFFNLGFISYFCLTRRWKHAWKELTSIAECWSTSGRGLASKKSFFNLVLRLWRQKNSPKTVDFSPPLLVQTSLLLLQTLSRPIETQSRLIEPRRRGRNDCAGSQQWFEIMSWSSKC